MRKENYVPIFLLAFYMGRGMCNDAIANLADPGDKLIVRAFCHRAHEWARYWMGFRKTEPRVLEFRHLRQMPQEEERFNRIMVNFRNTFDWFMWIDNPKEDLNVSFWERQA